MSVDGLTCADGPQRHRGADRVSGDGVVSGRLQLGARVRQAVVVGVRWHLAGEVREAAVHRLNSGRGHVTWQSRGPLH